jgi:hypothetical protein
LSSKYTIEISDTGYRKKIAKLILLGEGGFSIASPYHRADCGYLVKNTIDYSKRNMIIPLKELLEEYTASNQVKLSMHVDGFAQFSSVSGNNIRSGRDLNTGRPRGLGYMSSPLSTPVTTGPTASLSIWGINDFEDADPATNPNRTIHFTEDDFYHASTPDECNALQIKVFVLPEYMWWGVHERDGILSIDLTYNFESVPSTFTMRVIPLKKINSFLALAVFRATMDLSPESGYTLNGPGALRNPKTQITQSMFACYPSFIHDDVMSGSLDYDPTPQEENTNAYQNHPE